jgi:predicted TIM-barrel fold metal-dependent hydrolase
MEILEKHAPEHLLFGTDSPWTVQEDEVRKFLALPIAEDLKRRILWDNACRFAGVPSV